MDIVCQEKGGPTVDYYPEGHPLEGSLIFYEEWLLLNPYRKLTDVSRWHALHEALITSYVEINKTEKQERRAAWEQKNPDKVIPRKKEEEPFTGDLKGSFSKALDAVVYPERSLPKGEVFEETLSREELTSLRDKEEIVEDTDELS